MSFDIALILTIMCTMYIPWYAYRSPAGVKIQWHTLAAASGGWMTVFFVYFMVVELPNRPDYHMAVMCTYYCAIALTYVFFHQAGNLKVRNELRGNKSR